MAKRLSLTIRSDERFRDNPFTVIRLANVGGGQLERGDAVVVKAPWGKFTATVIETRDAPLSKLKEVDAELVLQAPRNGLEDLRASLETLYRFRPYWHGDDTLLRLVTLQVGHEEWQRNGISAGAIRRKGISPPP